MKARTTRVATVGMAVLCWAVLTACRNLDTNDGGRGPRVVVTQPVPGLTVPLHPTVSLEATDPDGVEEVRLSCALPGGSEERALQIWRSAPYEGTVDLTACLELAELADGGASPLELRLVFTAVDRTQSATVTDRTVFLDATLANLAVEVPQRFAPGRLVTVRVTSDVDLAAVPSLSADGVALAMQADPSTPRTWVASYRAAALGLDGVSPEGVGTAPLPVLEESARPVRFQLHGRALSGNTTTVELLRYIARDVWERPIPGRLADGGTSGPARAAVGPDGIVLPLVSTQPGLTWIPGYMSEADGTFRPLGAGVTDGGFSGVGFDRAGRAVLQNTSNVVRVVGFSGDILFEGQAPAALIPLRTVGFDEGVCQETVVTCGQDLLLCVGPAGIVQTPVTGTNQGTTTFRVATGDVYVAGHATSGVCCAAVACGQQVLFGQTPFLSTGTKALRAMTGSLVSRALPTGNGKIVLSSVGGTALYDETGLEAGTYLFPTRLPDYLLFARPDETLITLSTDGQFTHFEAWRPDETSPQPNPGKVLGYLDPLVLSPNDLPLNIVVRPVTSDGQTQFAVLLSRGGTSRVVVAMNRKLEPKWLYHYPRMSTELHLVGHEASLEDNFYLVDATNGYVVALTP